MQLISSIGYSDVMRASALPQYSNSQYNEHCITSFMEIIFKKLLGHHDNLVDFRPSHTIMHVGMQHNFGEASTLQFNFNILYLCFHNIPQL